MVPLPETESLVSVSVPAFRMPLPVSERPFVMVRPEILAVMPEFTEKSTKELLPLTVRLVAPSPVIV